MFCYIEKILGIGYTVNVKNKNEIKTIEDLISYLEREESRTEIPARLPDDQEFYNLYKQWVPGQLRDGIIIQQIQNHMDPATGFALVHNHFPYSQLLRNLPHIQHYVLWYYEEKSDQQIESFLAQQQFSWYYWHINSYEFRSIKNLNHAHVFVRFR